MDDHRIELEIKLGENMVGALRRYIDSKIPPGSFLTAVLCNNLKEACACADDRNRYLLFEYVQYLYSYCPSSCWGSPEKFHEWLKKDEELSQ